MKKFFFLLRIICIYLFLTSNGITKNPEYIEKGIKLFNQKKFDQSKIFFERDLVFDPKSEKSYLYLAKIFQNEDKDEEQEINLKSVLLLNPKT